ncbi:formiminotetrahydrofolate cyclodeaminase [Dethiosulfatibacter aminovorans DSM 17477]|uniref:Formiminotetrahydrofolate cyclodeaminase n=1 Tax=Dethiosulfatibacter aminovorans DSM 17477 TaxID=1121476 RepID=A0A1M6N2J3_9FIRM|nr:cyclodeaminase/cyclohydrolase family protein [Dethiosulfatibacter aminovorans]SHJ89927.1 formiminotetrahydrofolate cyclodeaminase [Dethiosulfatibacter aminovorans DSM 17477]
MMGNDILGKIIDSDNTKVGGGASSALSGAMAAGMISMVAKLSVKKEYGFSGDEYKIMAEELDILAEGLMHGAKKDEEAFVELMKAYKLPKETDEDKAARRQAIQDGSILASRVPESNAIMCRKVLDMGNTLVGKSNPNAASDLMVSIKLAELGVYGCILNIRANLPSIKDEKTLQEFEASIKKLES